MTYYACAKLGVICVPLNLGWGASEITYVPDHSRATGVEVESQLVPLISEAIADRPAVGHVVVTAGTGAAHSAGNDRE